MPGVDDRFEPSQVEFATEEERRAADLAIRTWQEWVEAQKLPIPPKSYAICEMIGGIKVKVVIGREPHRS